ncbi:hypothetical protein [Nonomuraea sp. NPDC050786]|uniref:hypothetical protein n=1 Tax=Nonomuraea sp. NPDC050786 TaxID=3154840 RepID=UPI0033DA37EF
MQKTPNQTFLPSMRAIVFLLLRLWSRCGNDMGKEGWELVGITPEIRKLKNGKPVFYLVFKRAAKEKT